MGLTAIVLGAAAVAAFVMELQLQCVGSCAGDERVRPRAQASLAILGDGEWSTVIYQRGGNNAKTSWN